MEVQASASFKEEEDGDWEAPGLGMSGRTLSLPSEKSEAGKEVGRIIGDFGDGSRSRGGILTEEPL